MAVNDLTLTANARASRGKNEARRMRVRGFVPAVLYGNQQDAVPIQLNPKEILSILRSERGSNTLFQLRVGEDGAPFQVMIHDYQLDPVKHSLLHADLLRIAADTELHLDIQVELQGEPAGLKEGGLLEQVLREIKVECLPADIPERILVDVSALNIGGILRLREVQPPRGVKFLAEPDAVIATVAAPRKEEEEAEAVEAAPGETPAEPEVVKKGKAASETEEESE